jgi:hypothetical protein
MHSFFGIAELVESLCQQLVDDKDALARLAYTASHFHRPAISLVWADLDSLGPLLALLPADAVRTEKIHIADLTSIVGHLILLHRD